MIHPLTIHRAIIGDILLIQQLRDGDEIGGLVGEASDAVDIDTATVAAHGAAVERTPSFSRLFVAGRGDAVGAKVDPANGPKRRWPRVSIKISGLMRRKEQLRAAQER